MGGLYGFTLDESKRKAEANARQKPINAVEVVDHKRHRNSLIRRDDLAPILLMHWDEAVPNNAGARDFSDVLRRSTLASQ